MTRTKNIRGKTYKYSGRYWERRTALIRAKTLRRQGYSATTKKDPNGSYVVWIRNK